MAAFALLVTLAIPMGVWGQAPVGTTLWGETWTGGEANETPSAYGFEGTTVYGGATLTYAQSSTNTKLYAEALAGGESPELLLSKSNQTWTISNIPTGQATGMALTFNSNKTTFDVTSTTTGITISGSQKSWTIATTSSVTTFNLTIENTGSSNARIDDIVLSVTTAGGDTPQPTTYTVTYDCNGGTSGCPQNVTGIEPNTQIQLADAPSKDGFDFDGWSDGNTTYGENEDYTVTGNVTFTAQWTENATPTPEGTTATLNIQAYAAANNWENGVKYTTATVAPVTFTANGGGNTGKYYESGHDWRFYQGESASITISVAEGYMLVSVTPTYSVSNGGVLKNGTTTIASGSTVNVSGTSVTFTVGNSGSATNGQVRFTNIDVTYVSNGGTIPPSITANNVEIAYDATSGSFNYTINNPVQGGYLTVDENESWISDPMADNGVVIFNTETNPNTVSREGIIRMRYLYDGEILTHNVTITQTAAPVIYTTIPDLFAAATSTQTDVLVTFDSWVVSGTSNKNVFVTDNQGNGFIIFDNNGGLAEVYPAGSILSGTAVSCALKKYNGAAELVNLNASDLTISSGGSVTIANVAMANLSGVNTGALVHYENLTCSIDNNKYYLSDGTTTIQVYNTLYAFDALEDGETYNITGIYQQFNSTKEILPRSADDIEEVVVTEPSVTVTPNTISAPFAGAEGTLALTYENIEEFISFDYYFCDANGNQLEDTDPDYPGDWIYAEINDENDAYTLSYIIDANDGAARTAYMKVYTFDDNLEEVYAIVTVNQAQYVVDYATLPFEYDGNGTGDLPNGFTVSGLGTYDSSPAMKFDGTGDYAILKFNERPGTLTFDIKGNSFSGGTFTVQTSEDGVTYTDLETYTELGDTQHESFTNLGENVRYIKWIYTEKVSGNVGLGNIALAEYTEPQQYTLTVEPFENLELITFVNEEMIMEGDGEIQVTNGNQIKLSIVANEGYVMETLMVNGVNHVNDIADDYTYTFVMPAENVTISATAVEDVAPTPSNYVRITALDQLTDGSKVIIAARHNATVDSYYAMKNATSNKPEGTLFTSMTSGDDEVVASTITDDEDNYYWTVNVTETGYTFTNASGNKIGYNSGTNFANNVNTEWTIALETAGQNAMVAEYTGFVIRNKTTDTRAFAFNGNAFGAYATTNMNAGGYNFFLDFFVETEPVTETYTLEIAGYEAGSDGGYYLIASPVTVNPANVEGMTAGEYDLYSFDQAEADEWRNYKVNAFNLEPGKGYLYAKQATEPDEVFHFELTGTPYNGEPITLSKSENVDFPGWNLVGNPFGQTAYIDRDFYVMKSDGSEIIESETDEIAVMQGIFVIAANDDEELTFSTEAPTTTDGKIVMNVSNGRSSVIDRATVRFGEGRTLPKFMFNDENTKIYITEGNEEFAVVRSIDENATPVSFHAAENGTYTLSINAENVEMEYLHLLDNMTGADVDLLANPSYTFEARTTDYANRFKLVYATTTDVNENNVEPFAFFNGSEWVINNEGEATLQVIDINGRMLSNETVNGNANVNINATSGIYMLRLVNGESVKTQKVVVK